MTPQEMYEDYQSLRLMNASRDSKIKLLEFIVAQGTNNWRVVGITPAALEQFERQEYRRVTGSGIQRAHLYPRIETYGQLIDTNTEQAAFWEWIEERDRTIFAVKGEHSDVTFAQAIRFDDPGLFPNPDQTVYFPALKVSYRHLVADREFLREFHAKYKRRNNA